MNAVPSDEYTAQQIASECMHNLRPYNLIRNMVSTSVCVGASFGLVVLLLDEAEMVTERPNVTQCHVFYLCIFHCALTHHNLHYTIYRARVRCCCFIFFFVATLHFLCAKM